ncbi:DUF262 domain-containing protein [Nocardioides sp. P86]|uniref:GmrSD restriction endonuclease domain-containing protein n=1 Tax=Nocardioides sp. P86 TaxID=2939569 RepID=UPI00203CFBDC|nr:DUF262 domain-containing protein [Nocardioides sp. P86]MCM3515077.1 DUF262 domain-containing protein [Nocardioides sp. P86]
MVDLFPGEKLDFKIRDLSPSRASDESINRKYVSGEVRIVTEQARYPLNTIAGMVSSSDYELNPEFQRRHRWSPERQSSLIESFIMNVPVPPIFLYEDEYSHYEVMDGLQRLTAISTFYRDELTLSGLAEWPELNGRSYSNLPEQVRRGIDRRYLSSIILLRETASTPEEAQRLKQLVFERINSGGERLKEQESRNAIHNGPLNQLCIALSRNPNLCAMWGIPAPDDAEIVSGRISPALRANSDYQTMGDVELVLRFFAHRQRQRIGGGALRTFLDAYLRQGNLLPQGVLLALESLFKETVGLVYDVLGERAFWLWRFRNEKWGWLARPTTTAYDAIMFVFSQHLDDAQALRNLAPNFRDAMPVFYEQHFASFDARTTNMSNLRERDELVEDLVSKVLRSGAYDTRA